MQSFLVTSGYSMIKFWPEAMSQCMPKPAYEYVIPRLPLVLTLPKCTLLTRIANRIVKRLVKECPSRSSVVVIVNTRSRHTGVVIARVIRQAGYAPVRMLTATLITSEGFRTVVQGYEDYLAPPKK